MTIRNNEAPTIEEFKFAHSRTFAEEHGLYSNPYELIKHYLWELECFSTSYVVDCLNKDLEEVELKLKAIWKCLNYYDDLIITELVEDDYPISLWIIGRLEYIPATKRYLNTIEGCYDKIRHYRVIWGWLNGAKETIEHSESYEELLETFRKKLEQQSRIQLEELQ